MKRRSIGFGALCILGILGVPGAGQAQVFAIQSSVVANGGQSGSSGTRSLVGTTGQAAVGMSGTNPVLCSGFWCYPGSRVVAIEDPQNPSPGKLEFGTPIPNPARGAVTFTVALPEASEVSIVIYDARGRQICTVLDRQLEAGVHRAPWDGRDERRRVPGPGMYFARLTVAGRFAGEQRFVILR